MIQSLIWVKELKSCASEISNPDLIQLLAWFQLFPKEGHVVYYIVIIQNKIIIRLLSTIINIVAIYTQTPINWPPVKGQTNTGGKNMLHLPPSWLSQDLIGEHSTGESDPLFLFLIFFYQNEYSSQFTRIIINFTVHSTFYKPKN